MSAQRTGGSGVLALALTVRRERSGTENIKARDSPDEPEQALHEDCFPRTASGFLDLHRE